jgi:hypothetical protein
MLNYVSKENITSLAKNKIFQSVVVLTVAYKIGKTGYWIYRNRKLRKAGE